MQRFSARELNQDVGRVKRAAEKEPVSITDRGTPAFVMMTQEEYERLTRLGLTLSERLADMRPEADFDFDPDLSFMDDAADAA
ncbi:MAG: type II toxin-antitoxin system prevent-host-death family antitoxin [Rhizobiaceae bacterium]|nr:type II toxin-antitoxin system prevent-host-death family antitoxin [Rhizobiaceae bacterium]